MKFETKAIHAGQDPEPTYGAVNVPIYQTSTYAQSAVGEHKGYEYARTGNPTRTVLETALAALEQGHGALCFASGMAAEATFLQLLKTGDHVVLGDDVYGGPTAWWRGSSRSGGWSSTPWTSPTTRPFARRSARRPAWYGWRRRPTLC